MPSNLPVVIETRDGSRFSIRPVTSDDKPLLSAGFARLSDRTRYLRFLVPTPSLSRSQLSYLSETDQRNHVAWGVLSDGEPVAIGRFVRLGESSSADVALTVVDEFQGRGVGPALISVLAESARARGIEEFHFDVLVENAPMRTVLARLGGQETFEGATVHVVVDVGTIPPPPVVSGELIPLLDEVAAR